MSTYTQRATTIQGIPNDTLVKFDTASNRAVRQCALSVAYCSTPNDINSAPLQQTQTVNIYKQYGQQPLEVHCRNQCPYLACFSGLFRLTYSDTLGLINVHKGNINRRSSVFKAFTRMQWDTLPI